MRDQADEAARPRSPALRRVLERAAAEDDATLLDLLASRLSGADLTTLLLEVFRQRALELSPAEVLRRYRSDRFVGPAPIPHAALRRAEDALVRSLPPSAEVVTLAPLTPLATHTSVATVDPRKVVATIRGSEVAADPTNALALEAASRRATLLARRPRSATPVHLAASQRVVRAQHFDAPGMSAHFQLFGFVSAGRDVGGLAFERENLAAHLRFAAEAVAAARGEETAAAETTIRVTLLNPAFEPVLEYVSATLDDVPNVRVVADQTRQSGRGYYSGLCFKVHVGESELGDGGFTGWTAKLLGNGKERLLVSGYGVDRLADLG